MGVGESVQDTRLGAWDIHNGHHVFISRIDFGSETVAVEGMNSGQSFIYALNVRDA